MQRINKKQKKTVKKVNQDSSIPVAFNRPSVRGYPTFSSSGTEIRVRHREYLSEVTTVASAATFNLHYVELNPGLFSTCPWLSAIANRFESYTFKGVNLHYVPSCGTSAGGSVLLAPDYDVSDYVPPDIFVMSTYPGCVRTASWAPATLKCEPSLLTKLVKERIVRSTDVTDVDLKLYDTAILYWATIGHTTVENIGSLWLEYDVVLRTPSIDLEISGSDSAKIAATIGVSKDALLGTAPVVTVDSYLPVVEKLTSTTLKVLRPGRYLADTMVVGTGLTAANCTFSGDGITTLASTGVVKGDATTVSLQDIVDVAYPTIMTIAAPVAWTTATVLNLKFSPYLKSVSTL